MKRTEFGGSWTEEKLRIVQAYLIQYRKIFTANERAKHFKTVYVDAFASTGQRIVKNKVEEQEQLFALEDLPELQAFFKGSVTIALDLESPFDRYVFIEKDAVAFKELQQTVANYPGRKIEMHHGDTNEVLPRWCANTNWKTHRAVVFLDPFGMQVEWPLLKTLAETKGIDLWMLFPISTVLRTMPNANEPPSGWSERLTKTFGTEDWKNAFYVTQEMTNLFAEEDFTFRDADIKRVQTFVVNRLKEIFVGVSPAPLILRNSHNTPLYLLFFAASNDRGAKPALAIANYLLKEKKHG